MKKGALLLSLLTALCALVYTACDDEGGGRIESVNGSLSATVEENASMESEYGFSQGLESSSAESLEVFHSDSSDLESLESVEDASLTSDSVEVDETPFFTYAYSEEKGYCVVTLADEKADLPSRVEILAEYEGKQVKEIDGEVFRGTSVEEVVLPDTVERIGVLAFANCAHLRSICLGEGLKEIGEEAFLGCGALTSVIFPQALVRIEENAFSGCSAEIEIFFENQSGWTVYAGTEKVEISAEIFAEAGKYLTGAKVDAHNFSLTVWTRREEIGE